MTPTEQVIAAAREVLAAEEQRLRFKVALPDSLRHKDWELVKQFPARHLAAWGALISALAALDAEAPQPAIVNKFGDTLRPEVQRFMVEAQAHLSATPPTTEKAKQP